MKISRDVRKQASALFRVCFVKGKLDETRVRHAAKAVAEKKPRHAVNLLNWFKKLVDLEIKKRAIHLESAVSLSDKGAVIFKQLEKKFGPALAKIYNVNPNLVGGLRIQMGSDVWDGSILQRLNRLKKQ
ncbi:MAG: F0F1 ATP synthase subunit delta [bacterium]